MENSKATQVRPCSTPVLTPGEYMTTYKRLTLSLYFTQTENSPQTTQIVHYLLL